MQGMNHKDGFLMGTSGDDVLTLPTGMNNVEAGNGDDVVNVTAGRGQVHAYAGAGDDILNLRFGEIDEFTQGHHVNGDGFGGDKVGRNTFNFTDFDDVRDVVVGRIEDFNPSEDRIQINGRDLDFQNLPPNVRVVAYNGEFDDEGADPQQWLLIDTGEGHLFYSLGGARVDMTGSGGSGAFASGSAAGEQEIHFIRDDRVLSDGQTFEELFRDLPDVSLVDPQDYIPAEYTSEDKNMIADTDRGIADVREVVRGSGEADLIAAGLNDDAVSAGQGDDRVWGGSGHDELRGDFGDDTIRGGPGNDVLMGGEGADVLNGDAGSDLIAGGLGADRFVVARGNGTDVVDDFARGTDEIDLTGTSIAGFGALSGRIAQDGDRAVIDLGGGDVVELRDVDADSLTAGDFVFAEAGERSAPSPEPGPRPEPEPEGDVRAFSFDADTPGRLVIEDFDVNASGSERTYDTVKITFEGRTIGIRDGDDLLTIMRSFESDGAWRPETDAVVSPDGDIMLRFDDDAALVLEGDVADEFSASQLASLGVDYESFM